MSNDSSKQRIGYFPESAEPPKTVSGRQRIKIPVLRLVLLAICLCVFAVSSALLIRYFSSISLSKRASRQMEEIYSSTAEDHPSAVPAAAPTHTPVRTATPSPAVRSQATKAPTARDLWPTTYPSNPTLRVSSAFYELQRQNPDIVGWLKIDGVVAEPVLQRDNEYYLTHNALKQRSVTGALFLDESCDLTTVPTQLVVHGHNMKEGAMFGALKKYKVKDASFYKDNPFIEFNTMYENGRYVIFAVGEVDIRPDRIDHLPFWYHSRFTSVSSFEEYVQKARSLSHYRCNVDVLPGDRLLTLATCTGTDDNKRLIVMARRIRDNENELELQMGILSTSDRPI